jgi:hypothetical protein
VITGFKRVTELANLETKTQGHHKVFTFKQNEIYGNTNHTFLISDNPRISSLIASHTLRIGDIADCVTGFYSGNDKKYLHPISKEIKNGRRYEIIDRSLICDDYTCREDILEGITASKHFIPILKGGGTKYFKPDTWYMDWGVEALKDYRTNKKARFQNAQYYFRCAIGVPMVSSSQITAALIENRLFDQSIVGIFPRDMKWLYYLLGFFNSPTCNKLIRTINPSANNSANYIKEIPFVKPSQTVLREVTEIVQAIIRCMKEGTEYPSKYETRVNDLIAKTYGF